ncbi:hypothetical protein CAPTEDRAFT_204631 [Capitella teleta]|uniref:Uncharacterized protein n=1 Tax=Capitella teleta TaxID=283909 RepID=R7ULD7_CAPTE|nr:hypothetical protein CAPTEDRAFT_204631 [Capitella teleta]|eukprot:ELU07025.1 hypothetical protein CAPTEDRAFT_204631 [Capitella teleta]
MAATMKRKRQIQDENDQFVDNFHYLRHVGEQKKRRLECDERKQEIKNWFNHMTQASPFKRAKTPAPCTPRTPRRRRLSLPPSKNVQKTSSPVNEHAPPLSFGEGVETRSSFKRRNSMQRLKKPLLSIQGTVRAKMMEQARRRSMRGREDYSLPVVAMSGQLDLYRFLAAQDERSGKSSSVQLSVEAP